MQRRIPGSAAALRRLCRYMMAECGGKLGVLMATGLMGITPITELMHQGHMAAPIVVACELLGYFGLILVSDLRQHPQRTTGQVLSRMLTEFGPAEALDVLCTRPLCVSLAMTALGIQVGALAGSIAADGVFYLLILVTMRVLGKPR